MFNLILLIMSILSQTNAGSPPDELGYNTGEKVKDFKLLNVVNDKIVSLSDYKSARGFIIVFTCVHCPYANAYEQRIIDLDKMYSPLGIPVIAINPNDPKIVPLDSPENMAKRAREKNYQFPYLFDETQEVAKQFGATRTPHTFILNKAGRDYIVEYIGAIDDNHEDASAVKEKYVQNALSEIMSGKKVTVSLTKAIGCTIKWKKTQ